MHQNALAGMRIAFDLTNIYYLPQFLPVCEEFRRRGAECRFIGYDRMGGVPRDNERLRDRVSTDTGCATEMVSSQVEALRHYRRTRPDWIVLGNEFKPIDELGTTTRTAMLYHGIGVKKTYYDPGHMQADVRFVEGEHRVRALRAMYPDKRVVGVGFAKLDPFFSDRYHLPRFDLRAAGLDPGKPTVLYAPTFYPSSAGCLPDDWPKALAAYNVIVKPHQFAYTHRKHREQLEKFERWSDFDNVHVAGLFDYSLVPYMAVANVLVSEASSALFEFAATDRPIVWCDFMKLRWGHRGPLRWRFERRMDRTVQAFRDIGAHAATPAELPARIEAELSEPNRHRAARQQYTAELIGPVDGGASARIADWLGISGGLAESGE